ncbi:hypothetical protein ACIOJE_27020 [Kitasatospora sp. NPDC087861]|uniref:hypothetical protein n=1 Tax=Kitasatospora sp. NPDC087861 TaxID=3364070 RepID=UPI00381B0349
MRNVGVQSTATNVAGQVLVPVLVASREKILDVAAYNHPSGDLYDDAPSAVIPAQADKEAAPAAA